jgi:hypothetical protein
MRRQIYFLASAMSLLLLAATVVFWIRRDGRSYNVEAKIFGAKVGFTTYDGRLAFGVDTPWPRDIERHFYTLSLAEVLRDETISGEAQAWHGRSRAGVTIFYGSQILGSGHFRANPWKSRFRTVSLAAPLAATIFACGSVYFVVRVNSRLRRLPPEWRCRSCAYNLTGNTSRRCPECGTPCATSGDLSPLNCP